MNKQTEEISIIKTKDGSHTLYNSVLDETYHSTHGSIQEANHVFIKNGIKQVNKHDLSVLEIGFGTGLNAILTYDYAKNNNIYIKYHCLETFPLSLDVINELNYKNEISEFDLSVFNKLHSSQWNNVIEINNIIQLNKYNISLQEYTSDNKFDVIYYDAFGPRAQKEMWEKPLFMKLFNMLKSGGRLVTYCAMGQFKRDLKACGYEVFSVEGPPGKREMTIAVKK